MPRLFFGLEIPAQIKARLLEARAEVSGAKWQSVEQMHITLYTVVERFPSCFC